MQAALEYARAQGCYKTILDCDDKVKPFYERLGFKRHSNGMRFDH
jgi:glucosamine-phosphate N-acetyltransferase